jgi:hypothetical protein
MYPGEPKNIDQHQDRETISNLNGIVIQSHHKFVDFLESI